MTRAHTAEHRAKISAAMTGRTLTDEHKAKIADAAKRRGPVSAEARAHMSAAKLGKPPAINSIQLRCDTHAFTGNPGVMGRHMKKHGGTCVVVRLERDAA